MTVWLEAAENLSLLMDDDCRERFLRGFKKLPEAAKVEFREILHRHWGQVRFKIRLLLDLLLILRSR